MRVFCSLREHFRRAPPAGKASGLLVGYGEQAHDETPEWGHAPFVVYVKMYGGNVVHSVKVDVFSGPHGNFLIRLAARQKRTKIQL